MIIHDLEFASEIKATINAQILRAVEKQVCHYRSILPNGWRVIIKMQDIEALQPFYQLDLQSNQGGGEFAPVKMRMLEQFPEIAATKLSSPAELKTLIHKHHDLSNLNGSFPLLNKLPRIQSLDELNNEDWEFLSNLGITRYYGGIRIPFDSIITEEDSRYKNYKGEIRIAFSGAEQWQDLYFTFALFQQLQKILNHCWYREQIWYNLRHFQSDPNLEFWINHLKIKEA